MLSLDVQLDASEALSLLEKLVSPAKVARATTLATVYMEEETRSNFDSQTDPDGSAWAALAASTVRQKGSSQILRTTSTLYGSIGGRRLSAYSGQVIATAPWGVFHQEGTSRTPARRFMGFAARHVEQIKQFYEDSLGD